MQATTHHKSGISSSQYPNANKDPSWVKLAIVCTVTSEQMTDHWSSSPRLAKSQCKKRLSLGQETPARKSWRKQRSSLQHHNARPQPLSESQCKQRPTTSQIDNRLQSRKASNDLSQVKEQQLAHQSVTNHNSSQETSAARNVTLQATTCYKPRRLQLAKPQATT